MQKKPKNNNAVVGLIAFIILGALVAGTIVMKSDTSDTSNTSSVTESSAKTSADSAATYKDGTYSATGSYSSPGGNEEIAITITIASGNITSTEATPKAASNESKEYQDEFVSGYKEQVIGKAIGSLRLGNVSGSSLTSRGFNEALDIIRSQAKV